MVHLVSAMALPSPRKPPLRLVQSGYVGILDIYHVRRAVSTTRGATSPFSLREKVPEGRMRGVGGTIKKAETSSRAAPHRLALLGTSPRGKKWEYEDPSRGEAEKGQVSIVTPGGISENRPGSGHTCACGHRNRPCGRHSGCLRARCRMRRDSLLRCLRRQRHRPRQETALQTCRHDR